MATPTRIPGIPFVEGRNVYTDGDGRHYGIAIHNTSNDASDTGEASYAQHRTDGTSAHLYADADSVTQSLPLTARAGHAGSREGNEHAIAVEITGTNGKSREWWLANVCWDELGRALAWVILNDPDYAGFEVRRASVSEMQRNPKVQAFYSHNDMRHAWGGTVHTDPGPNFPWDRLFAAVNGGITTLGGRPAPTPPATPATMTWTERLVHQLPTLARNDRGPHVRILQGVLVANGQSTKIDGVFGEDTERDVKAEQRQAGLTADGVVGPRTWPALLHVR